MQDKKPDSSISDDSNLVIVATPEYVKEKIEEHAKSRNHPYATQVEPGFVTLSNETDSDSELTVATSKAVKKASDLANAANQSANNANENANLALPVGVPVPWPTEIPPEGWLICNGASFDKERYPKLTLAYPSGRLPDLRGEFIRGWDREGIIDPNRALLSKQEATLLPSIYTYQDKVKTVGVFVTPPMNAYETEGAEGAEGTDIQPKDFDEPVYKEPDHYLTSVLTQGGVGARLATFRVRPRNIAFNYIVRAA